MRIAAFCLCFLIVQFLHAQEKFDLKSPDGNIVFTFYNEGGKGAYTVAYKKHLLVDKSFLSLEFKDGSFSDDLKAGKPVYTDSIEDYGLVIAKASHVHDAYKQMLITLQSTQQPKHTIQF